MDWPCIDLHARDPRAGRETEQRLDGPSAWCESPFRAGRERAALARQLFADKELVDLASGVIAINPWNRVSIAWGTAACFD